MEQISPSEQSPRISVPNDPSLRHVERACPEPVEGEEQSSGRGVQISPALPSPRHVERAKGEAVPPVLPSLRDVERVRERSPKQLEANRKNAHLSTGPKTTEGKSISAQNAITHGLWAKEIVIHHRKAGEDPFAFAELHNKLIDDIKPQGAIEEMLVEKIAVCYWRLRRCLRAEHGSIVRNLTIAKEEDMSMFEHPRKSTSSHTNGEYMASLFPYGPALAFDKFMRYETTIQRQLDRALVQLERSQRLRNGEVLPPAVQLMQL